MRESKYVVSVLVFFLLWVLPVSASGDVFILCFHSFLGTKTSTLDFSPEELGADLDLFTSLGYKFVTLDDAIAGKIEGSTNIAVTIDDGNHSVYNAYKNVFCPRGIKPELFIPPAIIDGRIHALSWKQIIELSSDGCGVGAHGYHHLYLSVFAFAKNEEECMGEIEKPADDFMRHTGTRPVLFAYPYGVDCPQAEAAVEKEGYTWGFLAGSKVASVRFDSPELNRYAIPRTIVYRWNLPLIIEALKKNLSDHETVSKNLNASDEIKKNNQ